MRLFLSFWLLVDLCRVCHFHVL
jgi:chaperonin GroEL